MSTRTRFALAAALALAAVSAVPAHAADKPTPGCAGLAFPDAAGDAMSSSPSGGPAASNLDILGGFFLDFCRRNFRYLNLVK